MLDKIFATCWALAITFSPELARANDKPLSKVNSWILADPDIDEHASKCGVRAAEIKRSISLPIRAYTKASITSSYSASTPFIFVHIYAMEVGPMCFGVVMTRVMLMWQGALPGRGDSFNQNSLFERVQVLRTPSKDTTMFYTVVENHAKDLAMQWLADN